MVMACYQYPLRAHKIASSPFSCATGSGRFKDQNTRVYGAMCDLALAYFAASFLFSLKNEGIYFKVRLTEGNSPFLVYGSMNLTKT